MRSFARLAEKFLTAPSGAPPHEMTRMTDRFDQGPGPDSGAPPQGRAGGAPSDFGPTARRQGPPGGPESRGGPPSEFPLPPRRREKPPRRLFPILLGAILFIGLGLMAVFMFLSSILGFVRPQGFFKDFTLVQHPIAMLKIDSTNGHVKVVVTPINRDGTASKYNRQNVEWYIMLLWWLQQKDGTEAYLEAVEKRIKKEDVAERKPVTDDMF